MRDVFASAIALIILAGVTYLYSQSDSGFCPRRGRGECPEVAP